MKKLVMIVVVLVAAAAAVSTVQQRLREQRAAAERLEREREEERRRQEELRLREARRREFVGLLSQAAFGHLWTSSPNTTDEIDSAAQKARLSRIYKADIAALQNGRLAALWSDARKHAERGLLALSQSTNCARSSRPAGKC